MNSGEADNDAKRQDEKWGHIPALERKVNSEGADINSGRLR
jgi:hypothetical protein